MGLIPSHKLLFCCEIGRSFALKCVFILFYEKLESAAEIILV